jgi:hypothetical protein
MKSRRRTVSYAQPCCGAGMRLHLDSALAAARSKHSARLQRKLKVLGRDLSASRASDVIDKECCFARVRLWPEASVRCVATIRPKLGVKPTCRDRLTDAVDPISDIELALRAHPRNVRRVKKEKPRRRHRSLFVANPTQPLRAADHPPVYSSMMPTSSIPKGIRALPKSGSAETEETRYQIPGPRRCT